MLAATHDWWNRRRVMMQVQSRTSINQVLRIPGQSGLALSRNDLLADRPPIRTMESVLTGGVIVNRLGNKYV